MWSWLPDVGALLLILFGTQLVLGAMLGSLWEWEARLGRALVRQVGRGRRVPDAAAPPLRRPIEKIGDDVRRLHDAFHREGMRFAKYEGCRRAYDGVLAEAAETLELDHLVGVLPAGAELDQERKRLERLLGEAGMLARPFAA